MACAVQAVSGIRTHAPPLAVQMTGVWRVVGFMMVRASVHTERNVFTSQRLTHLAVCQGTCSCWHYRQPLPPGMRPGTGHTPPPESATDNTPTHSLTHTLSLCYLELFLVASGAVCHLPLELAHFDPQISSCHLSLSTHHQLTQSIMNEHILCLRTHTHTHTHTHTISFSSPATHSMASGHVCTCVWTNFMRCPLMVLRWLYTLSVPSLFICCMTVSRRMKVPVRPTPALQWTRRGWSRQAGCSLRTRLMKEMTDMVLRGTPWSGQAV